MCSQWCVALKKKPHGVLKRNVMQQLISRRYIPKHPKALLETKMFTFMPYNLVCAFTSGPQADQGRAATLQGRGGDAERASAPQHCPFL